MNRVIRIAVVGGASSGKTSLIRTICNALRDDGCRAVTHQNLFVNPIVILDGRLEILKQDDRLAVDPGTDAVIVTIPVDRLDDFSHLDTIMGQYGPNVLLALTKPDVLDPEFRVNSTRALVRSEPLHCLLNQGMRGLGWASMTTWVMMQYHEGLQTYERRGDIEWAALNLMCAAVVNSLQQEPGG